MTLQTLLEPLEINHMPLKNRIMFPPMTTGYEARDGSITEQSINFYKRVAEGGASYIVLGDVTPVHTISPTPKLVNDDQIPSFKALADALVAAGLENPDFLPLAKSRVQPAQFIDAAMARVYELCLQRGEKKEMLDLASLSGELPDETVALLGRILARNYDVGLSADDVEMYLRRIEESQPESSRAGDKSADELAQYMDRLREKKTHPAH